MARNESSGGSRKRAQFVQWFGPVLDALRSLDNSGTADEVIERVAKNADLSDERLNEELPSGELRFRNQVQWARFYLAEEGLIDRSQRGVWSLSERGRKTHLTLDQAHQIFLKWVRIFQERRRNRPEPAGETVEVIPTPDDDLTTDYKARLLTIIQSLSAAGFERLSQRVLREAGFLIGRGYRSKR
jgi:restriction system protein